MRPPQPAAAVDAAVVALLVVSGQMSVWSAPSGALAEGRSVHAVLLAAITLPLLVRRRWPLAVLLVVVVASWLQYALGGGAFQPWFAMLLGLYAVAAHAGIRAALLGAVAVAVPVVAVDVPRLQRGDPVDEVVPAWVVLAGVWAFGRWMRRRRGETARLAERAAAAERDRDAQATRAVTQERARIARELHDLVAHSMGVIVIQSQAGQRALDRDPTAARGALAAIEATGRQGLAEMRRLLGLLTDTGATPVAPQPSLRQLDGLVAQVRAAGLPVEVRVTGDTDRLPAGVDLAAYRIVQEALTNVLKHAGEARAAVAVRHLGGALEVEVTDDGRGEAPAPERVGHGLVGMRERAALYGGAVDAGALPEGGYRVRARLAVDGETA